MGDFRNISKGILAGLQELENMEIQEYKSIGIQEPVKREKRSYLLHPDTIYKLDLMLVNKVFPNLKEKSEIVELLIKKAYEEYVSKKE